MSIDNAKYDLLVQLLHSKNLSSVALESSVVYLLIVLHDYDYVKVYEAIENLGFLR